MYRLREPVGTAWIPEGVLESIVNETVKTLPLETGGVLLGYWAESHSEVVITHAVGPGPLAIHSEDSFHPDTDYHTSEIARIYEASGRLYTYLGDWHSHPDGRPCLSHRDKTTIRKISKYTPARALVPLMAVVGTNPEWMMVVWS